MSETKLNQGVGFTPVIDGLLKKHGILLTLVFGRIWRYCQMDSGICSTAQQKIADDLGLSRKKVNECLQELVREGYLQDLTPGLKAKSHQYRDTGKANLLQSGDAINEKRDGPDGDSFEAVTPGYKVCNPQTHSVVTGSDSNCNVPLPQVVTERYAKKDILRNAFQETTAEKTRMPPSEMRTQTAASVSASSVNAASIFASVTGMVSIPGDMQARSNAIQVIEGLVTRHKDDLAAYLKPFYLAQCNAHSKSSGKLYARWSLFWLTDWAVAGEIPNYVLKQFNDQTLRQLGEPWVTNAVGLKSGTRSGDTTPEELYQDMFGGNP